MDTSKLILLAWKVKDLTLHLFNLTKNETNWNNIRTYSVSNAIVIVSKCETPNSHD